MLSTTVLLATLLYAGLGVLIFAVGFWIWEIGRASCRERV